MDIIWIFVISTINVLILSVSATFFLLWGYQHWVLGNFTEKIRKTGGSAETDNIVKEQMAILLRKFTIVFIVLEVSLIFYFTFWNILFYLSSA